MIWERATWIGAALLALAVPGLARAADGLDCMAGTYSADELAEIDALAPKFSFGDEAGNSGDAISQFGIAATYECFEANGWSENQLYHATLFELGRLSEAAYRKTGRLTEDQLRVLDKALAARERPELWAVMERAVQAGIENREQDTSTQDDIVLGGFILSLGIGSSDEIGEKVGELLGTMALQRMSRREFEALSQ